MKTLISIFAVTLALAFTGPAFAGDDRRKDRGRLREGRWHVGCYDQNVRREKDVSLPFFHGAKGRRLRSAPFLL